MAKKKKYDSEDGVWRTVGGRRIFIRNGQDLSSAMKESGKFNNMRKDVANNVKFKDMKEDTIKREGVTSEEYQRAENRERELRDEYNKIAREKGHRSDEAYQKEEELYDARQKYESLMEKDGHLERKYKMPTKNDEYELYKRAKENPDSIDPMTENSTDWEALDEKYKDRYDKESKNEIKGKQIKEMLRANETQQDDLWHKTGYNFNDLKNEENFNEANRLLGNNYEKENKYVKTLSGEYEKDNKGRKVTQKEYDDFRQAYRDGKISKEDYRNDNYEVLKERKMFENKTKDNMNNKFLDLKKNYNPYKDNAEVAKKETIDYISSLKEGTKLGLVVKDTASGWTSHGGYHDEWTRVKEYEKLGKNKWQTPNGIKTDKDMMLTALHNEYSLTDIETAKATAKKLSAGDKTTFREITNVGVDSAGNKVGVSRSKTYYTNRAKPDYDHFAGWELYSDDPNRYGDIVRNHNERNALKDRYQRTYNYLQSTTNMSGAEILELLKKIDEDRK